MRAPATRGRTVALSLAAGAVLALSTLVLPTPPGEAAPAADPVAATYVVEGVRDRADRSAVASTGAAVLEVQDHGVLLVQATPQEAAALQDQGYRATLQQAATAAALPGLDDLPDLGLLGFPSQDAGFHDHAETVAAVEASAAANPSLVQRFSLGESYEGRDLVAAKVSADVATDEDEPEVLFTCNQHAREHLTVEMCLAILDTLVSGYGSDLRVTELLDTREVWIAFMVNPDGVEHDIAGGTYKAWRKNRQPNPGSSAVGTDLNRNWGYEWGCCGGSSSSPSSETYRGSDAFSAVETQVVRDFVLSRVVGGEQQITAHIDWHTYSELVLWPYGFTYDETAPGLTQDDRDAHAALGVSMAASNGYTAQQSSDLYVTDGSINDWMWGTQKIFSYTFEMYPESAFGTSGFYPGDEVIDRETERNREAVLQLLDAADCVYEVIGKADQYCS